jgi:hypothetical protein
MCLEVLRMAYFFYLLSVLSSGIRGIHLTIKVFSKFRE